MNDEDRYRDLRSEYEEDKRFLDEEERRIEAKIASGELNVDDASKVL